MKDIVINGNSFMRIVLRIPVYFIGMVILSVNHWRWNNWQWWGLLVASVFLLIQIDNHFPRNK